MTTARPRQLFRHGGFYAATSLATAALAFAVLPVYVALLGKEGLGQVELLAAGGTALTFFVAQGLPAAWFRMRFDHEGEQRRVFQSTVFWYVVAASAVALGLLALVGPPLARRFTPNCEFYPLWLLTAVGACATVLGDMYGAGLQSEQRSGAYAMFALTRRGASIAIIVWFIAELHLGVAGKVAGEALAAVGFAFVVVLLIRPLSPTHTSRSLLVSALAYSLPLLPHGLAMQVVAMADRFVIGHYLGVGAVGVYSLGYRIAGVLETINLGLVNAYRAIFISAAVGLERVGHASVGLQREAATEKLAQTELALLAASSTLAQALAVTTHELLVLARIDLKEFAEAASVTYIVCWGLFAHAAYSVLATPLVYAQRSISRLPVISATAAILNLGSCILFVPRSGLLAAAWATAASYLTLACGAWFFGRTVFPLPRRWRSWGALFTVNTCVIAAGWQLDRTLPGWQERAFCKVALLLLSAALTLRSIDMTPRALLGAWTRKSPEP